jgi:outer membrane murein-binding lipoprotein Lpp
VSLSPLPWGEGWGEGMMCVMRSSFSLVAALALSAALSACHMGPRNYENENDRLRAEVLDLTTQVRDLSAQVEALDNALTAAEQRRDPTLPAGVHRPQLAAIVVGRTSCIILEQDQPTARLYLRTLDARQRFTQTIAEAQLTITATRPGAQAVTLATHTFDARQFDAAYRSSFAGTHYTLLCPVKRLPESVETVTAVLAVRDLETGLTLHTQTPLRYAPAESPAPEPDN